MDTGRAGTIGGRNLDSLLGKSYFAKHDLLPPKKILEALHDFPAPDFDNSAGSGTGAITRTKGQVRISTDNLGNIGWSLGAAKTKGLIIAGGFRSSQFSGGASLFGKVPTNPAASTPDEMGFYSAEHDIFNGQLRILKSNNGGLTSLVSAAGGFAPAVSGTQWSMALYWEPNVQRMFVRQGAESWTEAATAADGLLASIEAAGLWWTGQGVTTMRATCPIGIYTD